MENLKTQNTKEMNEGIETFADFEEVEDIVTAVSKGSFGCCNN